jgi:Flp pilus assembly CpaE family ATPase
MKEDRIDLIKENIISMKTIKETSSQNNPMYLSYKRLPDNLDYLSFSGRYYSGEQYYNEELFNELMMILVVKLGYDFIVFDVNSNLKAAPNKDDGLTIDDITKNILKYSSKIYLVVTQDISTVGACLQLRKIMKKNMIPVNDFRFVLNRFDAKASVTKRVMEDWLKVKLNLIMPERHKDIIDCNFKANALCMNTKDKEVTRFFSSIENDVLNGSQK